MAAIRTGAIRRAAEIRQNDREATAFNASIGPGIANASGEMSDSGTVSKASLKSRLGLGKRTIFMTVATVLLTALVVLRAADPRPVRDLRNVYFDYLQRLSPRAQADLPVAIVDLDEASLTRLGQWPWPRDRVAAMVDRLRELGAAVIVFDILFAEEDRLSPRVIIKDARVRSALSGPWVEQIDKFDNDVLFAEAMGRMPVVLGLSDAGASGNAPGSGKAGFAFIGQDPAAVLLPLRSATSIVPVLADAAAGVGVININPLSENDTLRDVPLVWRTADGAIPSLALEALRVALGESTIVVVGPNDGANWVTEIRLGGYTIPTMTNGIFPIHFRHERPKQYISAYQVLDPALDAETAPRLQGQIVFVGSSAAGLADKRTTALGERVPGVSIHAQVVEQILLGSYLTRTDTVEGAEIIALVLLGLLISLVLMLTGPVPSFLAGAVAGATTLGGSWFGFIRVGVLFDATFPLFGGFLAFSLLAMYQFAVSDREKRQIRLAFARYVAPSVLQEIDRKGHNIELGGKLGEVTVLFSDIRNFTPLSATMSAQDLVALLNTLLTDLSEEILAQAGTIDKYIGDEIMAFWNAPLITEHHQLRACIATLRMRTAMTRFNDGKARSGMPPIAIAMGMDCGVACVGNIGSRSHFNYTAIGDTVNVAARTQSACRHVDYDILVTAAVAQAAPTLAFLPAGAIKLKGVAGRTEVHILVGDEACARTDAFRALFDSFQDVLAALREGRTEAEELASRAMTLADQVDPHLRGFIDRCSTRAADFQRDGD